MGTSLQQSAVAALARIKERWRIGGICRMIAAGVRKLNKAAADELVRFR